MEVNLCRGMRGPPGMNGLPGIDGNLDVHALMGDFGTFDLDCYDRPPENCFILNLLQPEAYITYDNQKLLQSLKLGHIECSREAITNERNPRTLDISILFEDGDRSANRLSALELLLEFNFPFNIEIMRTFHNELPFCEEIMDFLNRRGISLIPKRLAFTKSAAN